MSKPYYQFISNPYNCPFGSSPNVQTEVNIMDKDLSLDEMLEQFQRFLQSAGYSISDSEYITLANSDDCAEEQLKQEIHDDIEKNPFRFNDAYEDQFDFDLDVSRLEVIDDTGRRYVGLDITRVNCSYQDSGRTIKLFIDQDDG